MGNEAVNYARDYYPASITARYGYCPSSEHLAQIAA